MNDLFSLHDKTVLDQFTNENSGVGLTDLFNLVGIHPHSLLSAFKNFSSQSFLAFQVHHNSKQIQFFNKLQNNIRQLMQTEYQKFPQPQEIKSRDPKYTVGANKSKRSWKVGVNKTSSKCTLSKGSGQTWSERKQRAEEKKALREQIKQFKQKKIAKRKQQREIRKQRKKQKMYNEIKSGQFQVIKNTKNMKKWSKKIKNQLVKLPAQIFENLINK